MTSGLEWTKLADGEAYYVFDKETKEWQYRVAVSTERDNLQSKEAHAAADHAENPEGNTQDEAIQNTSDDANIEAKASSAGSLAELDEAKKQEGAKRRKEAARKAIEALMIFYNKATSENVGARLVEWITEANENNIEQTKLIKLLDQHMDTTAGNPTPQRWLFAAPAKYFDAMPERAEDYAWEKKCEDDGGCFTTAFHGRDLTKKIDKIKEILNSFKSDIEKFTAEGGQIITYEVDK